MSRSLRLGPRWLWCLSIAGSALIAVVALADGPDPTEDLVRATVQIRNGTKRGSGTIIVSEPDRTWIVTAAHVVRDAEALEVELHRFNFRGRISGLTEGGGWPRLVRAEPVAVDPAGDVALLLIRGIKALPYSARWDPMADEPASGESLTSIGVDRGMHLKRWKTAIGGPVRIDFEKKGEARRFTVTARPPEHGRSGGGLFRDNGELVGVCTGFFEASPGRRVGAFASVASLKLLLERRGLEAPAQAGTSKKP